MRYVEDHLLDKQEVNRVTAKKRRMFAVSSPQAGGPPPAGRAARVRAPRSGGRGGQRSRGAGSDTAIHGRLLCSDWPWDAAFRDWVVAAVSLVRQWFGLERYDVRIDASPILPQETRGADADMVFSVQSDPSYRWVVLTVYEFAWELWRQREFDLLLRSVVHEWVHVLVEPLAQRAWQAVPPVGADAFTDTLESVVEALTAVIISHPPQRLLRLAKPSRR